MRTLSARTLSLFLLATLCGLAGACSQPFTDIVATSSEGVGPWDVANAQASGHTLTADVCTARTGVAETVSDRLLMQLKSKGYNQINLTMYARQGDATERQQISWTPAQGKQMQPPSQSAQSPCNATNLANPGESVEPR